MAVQHADNIDYHYYSLTSPIRIAESPSSLLLVHIVDNYLLLTKKS